MTLDKFKAVWALYGFFQIICLTVIFANIFSKANMEQVLISTIAYILLELSSVVDKISYMKIYKDIS